MKYSILFKDPHSHTISIELKISDVSVPKYRLTLPIWRPGRYEAAHYSKNITKFTAISDDGTLIKWSKISPHVWEIQTKGISSFTVTYDYYAYQMDAGNSWFDENLIYINFINCLIYDVDRMNEPCSVFIDFPGEYQVATGLKEHSPNNFSSINYFQLVDCPLIASNDLSHLQYEAGGIPFSIWINGDNDLDPDRLIKEFKAFSEIQIKTFGEFPESEYHFLILALPYKHYHGVEHANSTVICLGPGNELSKPEIYKELLGVSSHELFHAWNIIKIRPVEMTPYNFHKEVSFPTGYVAEGFTTYYGDLFLCRSKVFSTDQYFNELNTLINRHLWNFGRFNESVITSSMNLWVDGYQLSAPHKKSSIYVEGAMVAFCLDLMILNKTNGSKSLDDVMRLLWEHHGKKEVGYVSNDIQNACESVIGKDLSAFFNDHVFGVENKEPLLNELLGYVGCALNVKPNDNFLTKNLGIRYGVIENQLKIVSIAPNSPGEKYFSIGDLITTINEHPATEFEPKKGVCTFFIKRQSQTLEQAIEIVEGNFYPVHCIEKLSSPSQQQSMLFEKWLHQPF